MKKVNLKCSVIIMLIIMCIIGFFVFCNDNAVHMPYKEFLNRVSENEIKSANFNEDKIEFALKKDNVKYYTHNAESVTLKETLLLNDVEIKNVKTFVDLFYDMFDVFFIVVFSLGMFIGYRKISGRDLFKVIRNEKTKFSDVVGMDNLKNDMKQVIDIMKNKERFAKMGIKQPKGILLEGEPGNGKTLFARALAGEAKMNFIATKGADFESAIMAIGPMKVKSLFKLAKKNAPVIIFIDEFDGIGTKRNYSGSAIEIENTRIVTALLNELDGFKENDGILVIAATNNSKVLDSALIRAGRFDRKYLITYPNESERIELIKFYLKETKYDIDLKNIAKKFENYSSAQIASTLNEAKILKNEKNEEVISNVLIEEAIKLTKEK